MPMVKLDSDRPALELAVSIGMALSSWSGFELRLDELFGALADMQDVGKAGVIMDAINSFEVRLSICNRLMELEDVEPREAALWKRFNEYARKQHKKRHEIAHFSIVRPNNEGEPRLSPFFTRTKFLHGKARYLNGKEIRDRAARFDELREGAIYFWHRAMLRRGLDLIGPALEPSLIVRLRTSNS